MKINKETIKTALLEYVLPVIALGVGAYASTMRKTNNMCSTYQTRYISNATYGDAISAISTSDMFSTHKREAIEHVQRNEAPDYYSAVIAIANSDMFSTNKVDAIAELTS